MKSIKKLISFDSLNQTILRFPLSVICSVLLFLLFFLVNHDFINENSEVVTKYSVILISLSFFFAIMKITSEAVIIPKFLLRIVNFIGGISFIVFFYMEANLNIALTHFAYLMPILVLILYISPYLNFKNDDNHSVWCFSFEVFTGIMGALGVIILFSAGVCLGLLAINQLFGIDISGRIYGDIWTFSVCVIGTIYALSGIPNQFYYQPQDCINFRGIKFIVSWIAVPMTLAYLLILYAYFLKIIVTGDIPNGYLASLINIFIGLGVVTYLISWPLQEAGEKKVKLFHKVFFYLILIPLCFDFYAIWERVHTYGFTERRYFLLISAIWFVFLAFAYGVKKLSLKYIPISLAICILFVGFSPWSAVNIATESQFKRLKTLLVSNKLLQNGHINKNMNSDVISSEEYKNIEYIVRYICNTKQQNLILDLFSIKKDECNTTDIMHKYLGLGLYFNDKVVAGRDFYLTINGLEKSFTVSKYDVMFSDININIGDNEKQEASQEFKVADNPLVRVTLTSENMISIYINDKNVAEIPLSEFIFEKLKLQAKNENLKSFDLEGSNKDIRYNIKIKNISGLSDQSKIRLRSINFDLLIGYHTEK